MIAFIDRNGPPEAMHCPAFLCDHCHKPIAGKGVEGPGGIVIWRPKGQAHDADHRPGPQEVATVHKGACDRTYEATHPAANGERDRWWWMDLDELLEHLTHNIANPFVAEDNVEYVAPAPSRWRLGHYRRKVTP
jgi:hypothetical protein